jgi:hypothetical protein
LLCSASHWCRLRKDEVDLEPDELGREGGEPLNVAFSKTSEDVEALLDFSIYRMTPRRRS